MTDYGHRVQIRTEETTVWAYLVVPGEPEPMAIASFCRACFDLDKQAYKDWVELINNHVKVLLEMKYGTKVAIHTQKPSELN